MKNIKPYPSYKPSGIAWLGDIPLHWKQKRLKYVFKIEKRIAGELGHDVLSITQNGIKVKDIKSGEGQLSMDYSKYQLVYKGDFAMNHMDLLTGYVDISNYDGVISPDYRAFTMLDSIYFNKYLLRLLQLGYRQKIFYALGQGVSLFGRWRLSAESFNNFVFPIPSIEEQTAIAHFLDYKLHKIDRFIRKKKKLIGLLNEQKAAIINDAVTKGLDPSVKMKDSGIEWLGDVPEHWAVKKLKYSVRLNQHRTFEDEESINVKIALENIEGKTGRLLDLNENSFEGVGTIFKNGDVLFGKLRPYLAKVTAPKFEGSCVNEILVLSPNKNIWHTEFLKFRMLSSEFIKIVDDSTYGSKMPRASWNFIGGLKISCPPISKQIEIVTHIEKETALLTQTINTIEREIALVQEYRTTLIAEAVTGKIDVRSYELGVMNYELEEEMVGEMGENTEGGEEE
jgi:type I restriction enzyme, S subunit